MALAMVLLASGMTFHSHQAPIKTNPSIPSTTILGSLLFGLTLIRTFYFHKKEKLEDEIDFSIRLLLLVGGRLCFSALRPQNIAASDGSAILVCGR